MRFRTLLSLLTLFLTAGCGGEKHLPSSNPPEYDPKKAYTAPVTPAAYSQSSSQPAQLAEFQLLESKLRSLEADQRAKGQGKTMPFNQDSLQLLKGIANPCEALSGLVPALASGQLFVGSEGAALKSALGPDANAIARRMDEQLTESLRQSLGPGATDCPISERPRKNGSLSQPPRLMLTSMSSSQLLLFAQTTIPDTWQVDYDVQDAGIQSEDAPPDWMGYKTTHTVTRIGKVGRPTEGIYESYGLTIAPKAKKCPHLEGVVDGAFEWSFVMYRRTTEQAVLYRQHVLANLKGKVDDNAKVQRVDFEAAVTLQHIGTVLSAYSQPYGIRGSFTLDQRIEGIPQELRVLTVSGFSEGEVQARDAQLLGTLTVLTAYFSHEPYHKAQAHWNNPNTCVEILFTPATKTQNFAPNKSYQVKTELRTKADRAVVPAKFKEAKERPREGNGMVSPREKESQRDAPVTFTYRAPETHMRHSGFKVEAVSRAGKADVKNGEWELVEGYVLEFKSRIVQEPLNLPVTDFGVSMGSVGGFDSHVQATIPLRQRDDGEWVGEGEMQYETRPTTQAAHCEIRIQGSGKTTFHVKGGSIGTAPEPFSVNLIILPGGTGELTDQHCTSGTTPEKMKELFATQGVRDGRETHSVTKGMRWSSLFGTTRRRTFNMTKGGYEIGGWTPVQGSDVIAKKTITVSCAVVPLLPCREVTELTLRAGGPAGTP